MSLSIHKRKRTRLRYRLDSIPTASRAAPRVCTHAHARTRNVGPFLASTHLLCCVVVLQRRGCTRQLVPLTSSYLSAKRTSRQISRRDFTASAKNRRDRL
ncbi:hypothetical protein PUN28_003345 [Cardiocondyla obscurior]|uniref:Uncharacterized protein n=1 Tax=Cardiocondyla obscurior TaxID=286306 RepID=A0AAW2GLU7_9HYME